MRLVGYRLGRKHMKVIDRVGQVLTQAGRLAEQHARGALGHVEVAVTIGDGIPDLVCVAHEQVFGVSDWDEVAQGTCAGTVTVNPAGCLVVINAEFRGGRTVEVDKTLLHELTHAAQFNRRGVREEKIRGLAHNFGLDWMTEAEVRAANRRVAKDEREAEAAERLHRQLAKAVA